MQTTLNLSLILLWSKYFQIPKTFRDYSALHKNWKTFTKGLVTDKVCI